MRLAAVIGIGAVAAASSMTWAARNSVPSSNGLPMSCSPSGVPCDDSPPGTEMPGRPARFTVTVNTSFRYICTGSSVFSPSAKAAVASRPLRWT